MKNVLSLVFGLLIVTISGCATVNYIPLDYSGKDVGYAIISIGHAKDTNYSSYKLLLRKKDKSAQNVVGYRFGLKKGTKILRTKIL